MDTPTEMRQRLTGLVRWTARVWSICSVSLFVLLCVGEGIHYTRRYEWIGFLLYPVGVSAGMILGWWREGMGGVIAVGSVAVFYALHLATAGTLPAGWGWPVLSAPGLLFLLSWFLSSSVDRRLSAGIPRTR